MVGARHAHTNWYDERGDDLSCQRAGHCHFMRGKLSHAINCIGNRRAVSSQRKRAHSLPLRGGVRIPQAARNAHQADALAFCDDMAWTGGAVCIRGETRETLRVEGTHGGRAVGTAMAYHHKLWIAKSIGASAVRAHEEAPRAAGGRQVQPPLPASLHQQRKRHVWAMKVHTPSLARHHMGCAGCTTARPTTTIEPLQ